MRIGTRGSALALAQAGWVADAVGGELVVISTSGDAGGAVGDKSRWVDTIEAALVAGEIDLAVHSAKDVPGELAEGTAIVAVPVREDPSDVLLGEVPDGATVGTSSLRRAAQLRAWREDLRVVELRGNVDTRLRKLAEGEVDAIVLAAAGLRRLGREESGVVLDDAVFVPAAGQGALALQALADNNGITKGVQVIASDAALAALETERAAVRVLGADCHSSVGVYCDGVCVRGFVGAADGSKWVLDYVDGMDGAELGRRLLAAGGREILG